MANARLLVCPLDGVHYRVTGGRAPHVVDVTAGTCDCADFAYRGRARPCKHLRAVTDFRAADPQGPMLDALSESDTLDVIDPHTDSKTRSQQEPEPEAVAVADAALRAWRRELAAGTRTRETFDSLWLAACATLEAREALSAGLSHVAARAYALARALVERSAAA
jgi:hypothetical protein